MDKPVLSLRQLPGREPLRASRPAPGRGRGYSVATTPTTPAWRARGDAGPPRSASTNGSTRLPGGAHQRRAPLRLRAPADPLPANCFQGLLALLDPRAGLRLRRPLPEPAPGHVPSGRRGISTSTARGPPRFHDLPRVFAVSANRGAKEQRWDIPCVDLVAAHFARSGSSPPTTTREAPPPSRGREAHALLGLRPCPKTGRGLPEPIAEFELPIHPQVPGSRTTPSCPRLRPSRLRHPPEPWPSTWPATTVQAARARRLHRLTAPGGMAKKKAGRVKSRLSVGRGRTWDLNPRPRGHNRVLCQLS